MSTIDSEIIVTGMTCQHCVRSVTEELSELAGVTDVSVDLNPGAASRVTIRSEAALDQASVRAAVEEAGYALADQA